MAKAVDVSSLAECIDSTGLEVLNASNPELLPKVLNGGTEQPLKSDCDEQLLVRIPFTQPVKLHSLVITGGAAAPRHIKLFTNKVSMTFDDVESFPPTQTLELSASDFTDGVATVPLQYVKFQCVQSLTAFVEDNLEDGEVTELGRVQVLGVPIKATNVNELKKQEG